uniref:NYN domain-containing protein n=1 Tax=Amycolatopsis sp. CA-096443 TaxID=3239919 RepID=UPI003F495613
MGPRCAVYVDAGYALAAAASRATGTSLRDGVAVDYERMIDAFVAHAVRESGLPLLRVHWYDAARDGVPDPTQQRIGLLRQVKLRLGRTGPGGEQKGVDLRIGLDLVGAAGKSAVEVVYLVSGDSDLAEAVEEAQTHGVRVFVLAIPMRSGEPRSISRHLQIVADGLDLIDAAALDAAIAPQFVLGADADCATGVDPRPRPKPPLAASREPRLPTAAADRRPATAELVYSSAGHERDDRLDETIDQVVQGVLRTWHGGDAAKQHADCDPIRPSVPQVVDSVLLRDLSDALGVPDLSDAIRHRLRARFRSAVEDRPVPSRTGES